MEKRLFSILDEMNQDDAKNGTRMVEVSTSFIAADRVKKGAKISMGLPESALFDIASQKKIPVIVLFDSEEYFKRRKSTGDNAAATGIELIAKEREEQVSKHHINTGMDVLHNSSCQLAYAAERLCVPELDVPNYTPPMNWNEQVWDKMTSKPYKERLIIAGALIAAELDRLNALDER